MIFTPGILLRLAAMVVLGVVLQLAFVSQIHLLGTRPDIVPAIVVSIGLLSGSLPGAAAGFATGLLVDSALLQTMGASSLVLLGVGYAAGRFREVYDITSALTPPLLTGGLTLVAVTGYAVIQTLLGVEAPVSLLIVRDAIVKSALAVPLAVPVYLGMRRGVRSALVEDRALRRRARAPLGMQAS